MSLEWGPMLAGAGVALVSYWVGRYMGYRAAQRDAAGEWNWEEPE
jgi:hypothetical protein